MEIDNTKSTDNSELTGNKAKENNPQNNNKKNRNWFGRVKAYIRKHPYRILSVILFCIALFFLLRETGVISKHVYEEIENLGEREGVCFDNLLLSGVISLYNNTSGEYEDKYLCIYNTGDIYCFEWFESRPWNWYYWGDEEGHERGYDDTIWSRTENVVYLGKLSNRQVSYLDQYVRSYDIEGEYYNTGSILELDSQNNVWDWQDQKPEESRYMWKYYNIRIYWHEQAEKYSGKDEIIESCEMNNLFGNIYEKGELRMKSYDENALAALKLFESSWFYYRWVYICLHNG